ncbi:MAG: hypothetical protein OER86_04425 [Phycisphaerae bacterium]|nr:hypothetical protein [Phycisphaerae bacterium]
MSLLWTPATLVISVIVVAVTAALCLLAWRRSGHSRRIGFLELLRFVLVVLVVITLNQPEWLQEVVPEQRPTLAVLYDTSGSMATRDVLDAERLAAPPQSRADAANPLVAEALWAPVAERMKVVIEPYGVSGGPGGGGTDINAALSKAIDEHPNLRSVVLIGDGDWNIGDTPMDAATRLRVNKVPVFAVGVGRETRLPDVRLVSVDAPTFAVANKPVRIPYTVESWLPRELDTVVTLKTSTGEEVTKSIRIPAKGKLTDAMVWRPDTTGEVTLTLSVPVDPSEVVKDNNEQAVPLAVRREALKVLIVESFPRWEYRYLRNALERDPGVEVNCLLLHPGLGKLGGGRGYLKAFPPRDELLKFDVVFLGDVGAEPGQLTVDQCRELKQMVGGQAAGLVFLPGPRGHEATLLTTELEALYPVHLDTGQPRGWGSRAPGQFELTDSGRRSLLTRLAEEDDDNARVWKSLPGFHWHAAVRRAKAGSEVLASHGTASAGEGRTPLIVTRTFGTGKILFMGTDGAWRWRQGVEDKYHYRFWGQVVRWMAYQRKMSQGRALRLFHSPDRPQADSTVTLNVNALGPGGEPLQSGNVVVQIASPGGQTDSVRLAPRGDDAWGLFTGTFTPTEGGRYRLVTSCRENGETLETEIAVQSLARERVGQPARPDVLAAIAQVTRGRVASAAEIHQVVEAVSALPEPSPVIRRLRIWAHPLWGGFIVLLLGVFWVGRKMVGMI